MGSQAPCVRIASLLLPPTGSAYQELKMLQVLTVEEGVARHWQPVKCLHFRPRIEVARLLKTAKCLQNSRRFLLQQETQEALGPTLFRRFPPVEITEAVPG